MASKRKGRPRGSLTTKCPTCGKGLTNCKCENKIPVFRKFDIDPMTGYPKGFKPAENDSPPQTPPKPESATNPPTVGTDSGGGVEGAFKAREVSDSELQANADAIGLPQAIYEAPAEPPPAAKPANGTSASGLDSSKIADAVNATVTGKAPIEGATEPATPDAVIPAEKKDKLEKVALTAEDIAQLRAISVAATQGIFFLNNWAVGRFYYKTDVLDLPPPVPQHVQSGADLLQPTLTRMIGTHTSIASFLAFAAILAQHNQALAKHVAKERAALKGKPAPELEAPKPANDTVANLKERLTPKSAPVDPGPPAGSIRIKGIPTDFGKKEEPK